MRHLILFTTFAALLLPIATHAAPAPRTPRPAVEITRTWTRTDAPMPRFERVAVLPPAGGGATATVDFSDRWAPVARRVALSALDGSDCRKALLGVRIGHRPALEVAQSEMLRQGTLAESTARFLARVLQVDALMMVRIDRWEQQSGVRTMAYVEATTRLMDSTGTAWWSSTGSAHIQSSGLQRTPIRTSDTQPAPPASISYTTTRASISSSSGSSTSGSTASSSSRTGSSSSSGSSSGSSAGSGTVARSVSTRPPTQQGPMPTPGPVPAPPYRAVVDSLIAKWGPLLPVRP
jgi:hypothetical protein